MRLSSGQPILILVPLAEMTLKIFIQIFFLLPLAKLNRFSQTDISDEISMLVFIGLYFNAFKSGFC
jgi:hypothetical protein